MDVGRGDAASADGAMGLGKIEAHSDVTECACECGCSVTASALETLSMV